MFWHALKFWSRTMQKRAVARGSLARSTTSTISTKPGTLPGFVFLVDVTLTPLLETALGRSGIPASQAQRLVGVAKELCELSSEITHREGIPSTCGRVYPTGETPIRKTRNAEIEPASSVAPPHGCGGRIERTANLHSVRRTLSGRCWLRRSTLVLAGCERELFSKRG